MRREGQLVNNTDRGKKGENEGGGKGTGEKAQTPGHLAGRMKRIGELWRVDEESGTVMVEEEKRTF